LLIDQYFVRLEQTLASHPHVVQTTLTKDKRAPHIGFVKGTVLFSQGIQLSVMEFVQTEPRLVKTKYRYHCQDAKGKLLFRYDNAPHHQTSTFPHHKHVRMGAKRETIVASLPPSIEALLDEVVELVEQETQDF
jgi:hypothetical protein